MQSDHGIVANTKLIGETTMSKSLFEQNGGTYHEESGYRIPNFALLEESKCIIGICGKRRLDYLKKHRRILYVNLLTSGKLHEHLLEIDIVANNRRESIIAHMMKTQGVTEQLKAENQMLWVGRMTNICDCADEIVHNELVNA